MLCVHLPLFGKGGMAMSCLWCPWGERSWSFLKRPRKLRLQLEEQEEQKRSLCTAYLRLFDFMRTSRELACLPASSLFSALGLHDWCLCDGELSKLSTDLPNPKSCFQHPSARTLPSHCCGGHCTTRGPQEPNASSLWCWILQIASKLRRGCDTIDL